MSTEFPQVPNEPDDQPDDSRRESNFPGTLLRFVGMLTIVGVIMYAAVFEDWNLSTEELVALIVIGLLGGAAHFAGRKLAPGNICTEIPDLATPTLEKIVLDMHTKEILIVTYIKE